MLLERPLTEEGPSLICLAVPNLEPRCRGGYHAPTAPQCGQGVVAWQNL